MFVMVNERGFAFYETILPLLVRIPVLQVLSRALRR